MRAGLVRRSGDGSGRYLMAGMVVPGLTVMAAAAIGGKTGNLAEIVAMMPATATNECSSRFSRGERPVLSDWENPYRSGMI